MKLEVICVDRKLPRHVCADHVECCEIEDCKGSFCVICVATWSGLKVTCDCIACKEHELDLKRAEALRGAINEENARKSGKRARGRI